MPEMSVVFKVSSSGYTLILCLIAQNTALFGAENCGYGEIFFFNKSLLQKA
jgi:hypothetical protein